MTGERSRFLPGEMLAGRYRIIGPMGRGGLFTGKAALSADPVVELRRLQKETTPPTPSILVELPDPAVERANLRCLEPDPRHRPASALAVAAALPGGDPLASALQAGEIPSPEMAAAGAEGALDPKMGLICLLVIAAAVIRVFPLAAHRLLIRQVPLPESPEVPAARAQGTESSRCNRRWRGSRGWCSGARSFMS